MKSGLRTALVIAGVGAVYIASARLGEMVATLPGNISPVWPPSGVALAAVLIFGRWAALGVWLGAILNGVWTAGTLNAGVVGTEALVSMGDALSPLAGAALLGMVGHVQRPFDRLRTTVAFIALAAVAATVINPTLGLSIRSVLGSGEWDALTWLTWWLGDAVGVLVITPLLLAWRTWPAARRPLLWWAELVGVEAAVLGIAWIVITAGASFEYTLIPVLVWAALRLGLHGVTLALLTVSLLAIVTTSLGVGAFAAEDLNRSLLLIQAFVGVASITPLVLVAAMHERRAAAERAQTERVRRTTLETDLAVAQDVQRALLPSERPLVAGYEIVGWNHPADQTGGDYFDWQVLPSGRWAVSIADVTGHGIGPALITAFTRAYARSNLPGAADLVGAVARINALVYPDLADGRFVTFAAAVLDAERHTVELVSAGHGPTIVWREATGEAELLAADGMPLGIVEEWDAERHATIELGRGDAVILMTDGIFERSDAGKVQFGIERVVAAVRDGDRGSAEAMVASIRTAAETHAGGAKAVDDATIVVMRREA